MRAGSQTSSSPSHLPLTVFGQRSQGARVAWRSINFEQISALEDIESKPSTESSGR